MECSHTADITNNIIIFSCFPRVIHLCSLWAFQRCKLLDTNKGKCAKKNSNNASFSLRNGGPNQRQPWQCLDSGRVAWVKILVMGMGGWEEDGVDRWRPTCATITIKATLATHGNGQKYFACQEVKLQRHPLDVSMSPSAVLPYSRIPAFGYSGVRVAICMALADGNTDIIRNKPKGMQSPGPEESLNFLFCPEPREQGVSGRKRNRDQKFCQGSRGVRAVGCWPSHEIGGRE